MDRIQQVLEQQVRPALQTHHGDIELVEITADRFVKVRLTGECSTCPGAEQTVSEIVETAIKAECPGIKGVILTRQVHDDLISQALAILRKEKAVP